MDHELEVHENCDNAYCNVCQGGLSICTVCGCVEASLASECPGFPCYTTHADAIYNGEIDYRNGKWVKAVSKYAPYNVQKA